MKSLKCSFHPTSTKTRCFSKTSIRILYQKQFSSIATQNSWRKFFEEYANRNSIIKAQDWYQVDIKTLDEQAGNLLKEEFEGSLYHALCKLFPETEWHPWKFTQERLSSDFWKEQKNQRKFFDDLGKQIGIQTLDDWYQTLSVDLIDQNGCHSLLKQHNGSPAVALMAAYPEHNWIPWKFNSVPKGYWKEQSNQRKFFDDVGSKIGIQTLDDWYQKLSIEVLAQHGGGGLLPLFKNSPMAALMAAYPEHTWVVGRLNIVPRGHWKDPVNQRTFFDELGKKIGVQTLDDWYHELSFDVVVSNGGSALLKQYRGSPATALMAVYPEHRWLPWKFNHVPHGYWKDPSHQTQFFDEVGRMLGIQNLDDWYQKLSEDVLVQNGGGGLLSNQYGNSPAAALMAAYPDHNWAPWKFTCFRSRWNSRDNIKEFLSELSEKLSIQTLDDWYRVDMRLLIKFGAGTILLKYKGLYNLLKEQYPNHPWDSKRFQQVGKKGQRWLAVTLKKIFPDEEILEDYMHPKVAVPETKRPMQLDVFIPSRSLAFEYQGIQHYEEVGVFNPTRTYQQRDEEKRNLCAANNIKLIEVPYWWNRTQESLQEIIGKAD